MQRLSFAAKHRLLVFGLIALFSGLNVLTDANTILLIIIAVLGGVFIGALAIITLIESSAIEDDDDPDDPEPDEMDFEDPETSGSFSLQIQIKCYDSKAV